MIYNKEQIDLYLKKMEYNDEIKIDYETLCKLQIAHLTHIPYENIDVLNRKPISLEAQDLFDKMIVKQRGGYCFELNGLYSNLLKSLGFDVTNLAVRFIYQDGNTRMRLHRILKIDIDDKSYISDVGVLSELSRKSLELEAGKVQNDGKCDYKFEYNPKQEGEYILYQRKPKKDWKQIYSFSLEPQLDIDYVLPSFYCESHPNSPFINSMKVARYTEDEHIRFFDGELIFYKDGQVIKIEKVREDKIDDVLKEYFNIVIDNFVKVLV